ncbi:hypothetical protein [Sulfurirhabdus autotrophica]|uniref:Uncharacterized protein n=1 Tax=Sulfurirhabdus autotrophica TaxID=1706046 RepID=A0A4R3Y8W9_9PROT|nr:hypothetical protein [Sulfurirhabdus autotrophica]TCV88122.1 hypothetical protein EDC63_10479 [Sulfurirhabdus autotrophica]
MIELNLNQLLSQKDPHLRLMHGQRGTTQSGGLQQTGDIFDGAACFFLRADDAIHLKLEGSFALQRCQSGGWMLKSRDITEPSYWMPATAKMRRINPQGHILDEAAAEWVDFDLDSAGVTITFTAPQGWVVDAVLWKLDTLALIDELQSLALVETQGYFLLGSHTRYDYPADLYRHLVNGWVYEDRYAWPHRRRICSENDAHAMHLIFEGLERTTGKRIYGLLKTQLLLSVLSRQSEDGGFRHGEWTDGMESHYRLHCSAMHLMMDSLCEDDDPVVKTALARGMHFISDKFDRTAIGDWFYHDELETSEAGMRNAPFKWWPRRSLGKSPQNMLVLNTQLDTLVALSRYSILTGDTQYATVVDSGYEAAQTVLSLRPMEWLYRLVFSAVTLTLLPTEQVEKLPLWKRLWKRIGWQVFVPRLPRLKTRFPRLVMPGGYIDRELSLQTWAYDYLAVNLMDLVRAEHGTQRAAFMPYIKGILHFCAKTGIARRWLEHKGRSYALGFYAEALYLLSLHGPDQEIDAMFSEALILCVQQNIGLPPSLLGGNAEAQAGKDRVPQAVLKSVVVANVSRSGRASCLVVNTGKYPVKLGKVLCAIPEGWSVSATEIPALGWLRIEA